MDNTAFNLPTTGPIHSPGDGRPTPVQVTELVKQFGKLEAVKSVSLPG